MALCAFAGNDDMYGLGVRLGYYLQWYGGIIASLLAPSEVPGARFTLGLYISATFTALVIQTVQGHLYAIEIYIILLLTFGAYLFLVPLLLWRLLTGCEPLLDPSRFPLVDPGPMHSDLHTLLLLAVTGYQLWFWFSRIQELNELDCRRYGFMFAKVPLNNRAFQVVNIVLYFVLGVAVLVLFALRYNSLVHSSAKERRAEEWQRTKQMYRRQHGRRALKQHVRALQTLDSINNFITATIVVTATELTINWNHVTGVDTIASAGQLIPFIIGLGIIPRVLYVRWKSGPPSGSSLKSPFDGPRDPYILPQPLPDYAFVTPMASRSAQQPRHGNTRQGQRHSTSSVPAPLPVHRFARERRPDPEVRRPTT